MGEDLKFLEIVVFAMIAGFVLLRLHRVLGRRTGHERPPPEPVADASDTSDTVVSMRDRQRAAVDAAPPEAVDADAPAMTRLKALDPLFAEEEFLSGARGAFEIVLTAFAQSDKDQLRPLLGDEVYQRFAGEIDRRREARESLEMTLVSIILADLAEVSLEGGKARITVKFVSEQVNVRRNADGEVIDGDETYVEKVNDLWTFARDMGSRDPNWALADTQTAD